MRSLSAVATAPGSVILDGSELALRDALVECGRYRSRFCNPRWIRPLALRDAFVECGRYRSRFCNPRWIRPLALRDAFVECGRYRSRFCNLVGRPLMLLPRGGERLRSKRKKL